ncbi:MAG: DNA polymerase III subunit alpha [Bacilli bacterium]|nr:DNA polymerase III subunit alpha [Bacilli bacterium]
MYTPLYVKSNYSFLTSLVKIDDLIKRCKKDNITSIALTDNNMIAALYFYKECEKNDIKPIIGLEITLDDKFLLYAKDYKGYQNLLKIVTRIDELDYETLKKYNDNIICIIPLSSKESYNKLKLIYADNYIGVKNKDEEIEASKLTNEVVFLNEILYLTKNESEYYKYLIMMKEKKNVLDDITYDDHLNYLLSINDISKLVSKKTIDKTNEISDKCNVKFPESENRIPHFNNSLDLPSDEYLKKLSIKGLEIRLNNNVSDIYKKRLLYELDIIKEMGFPDYFLIVYDYVKYAKKSGILVGPGRGSAGGSLVAYALGIIDVDPIEYDLLFERFLNPGRVTMPDIDIDFPDSYREQVIEYTRKKYGEKRVAGIIAIGTLKAKAVLDDVARVLKIDQTKTDRLKRFIDFNSKLKDVYEQNEEFKSIVDNDDRLRKLYDLSIYFEGFPKNTTIHASGIVIGNEDLDEIIPLVKQDGAYISSYEMGYLEELGLLKMDFLGNRNLTTVMEIIESIKEHEGIDINFLNIPLDDKDTLKLFYNVNTNGIFQFESDVMKNLLKNLKVEEFNDIVAADALVRPGPDTNTYIERKNNKIKIEYPNDALRKILEPTYGVLVYQEQIMQIANVMAGFTLSEADLLRRAMSKKKKDLLKVQEEKFIEGSIKNGYDYKTAKKYYEDILAFAEYGFNKSHAVAYSIIAYKMAYLKVHYPKYFFLSLLSMIIGNDFKTSSIVREARSIGVKFYLPDINKSTEKYEIVEDGVLFPLSNIRNIGVNTALEIVKIRDKGFKDIFECLTKLTEIGINKKTIESLIYASCFDSFGYNKNTLLTNLDNLLTFAFIAKGLSSDLVEHPSINEQEELSSDILMAKEKELFGFYLSYHPTTKYKDKYKVVNIKDVKKYLGKIIDTIVLVEKIKIHKDKKGNEMAFITGSDEIDSIEYTVFSKTYDTIRDLAKGDILLVQGKVEKRNAIQIIAEKAKIISER